MAVWSALARTAVAGVIPAFVLLSVSAAPARAVVLSVVSIVDTGDPSPFTLPIANPGINASTGGLTAGQYVGIRFVTLQPFSGVQIYADLQLLAGAPADGRAFLTTAVGPTATAADVVAQTDFVLSSSGLTSLFSGLSLAPDTYNLIIAPDETETDTFYWRAAHDGFAGLLTFQAGHAGRFSLLSTTLDVAFPPGSAFPGPGFAEPYPLFQILADVPLEVPEPPAILLLLAGLTSLATALRAAPARRAAAIG